MCVRSHQAVQNGSLHNLINVVGVAAGLCSMASFVPQLLKMLREKHAEGVSLRTYLVMVTGFVLWVAYAVGLGSWPIAASNAVNLVLSGWILGLKFRFERRGREKN